jgi:hypothetical protein
MAIPLETLLAAALILVYLADSARFLSLGEAVIGTRRARPRSLSCGSALELGGRRPFLPNPLTPFWPELRIEWATWAGPAAGAAPVAREMHAHLQALRGVGALAGMCALLIALAAPRALVASAPRAFVACALLCYLCAALAGTLIVLRRRSLDLTLLQALALAIVGVVCLPCSANLARAACARRRWRLAAADIPALGFPAQRARQVQRELAGTLRYARRFVAEDGSAARVITEQLRRLEGGDEG